MFDFIAVFAKSISEAVGGAVVAFGLFLGGAPVPIDTNNSVLTDQATTSELFQIENVALEATTTEDVEGGVSDMEEGASNASDTSYLLPNPKIENIQSPVSVNGAQGSSVSNTEFGLPDFTVRCLYGSADSNVTTGKYVNLELKLFEGQNSGLSKNYDIQWFIDGKVTKSSDSDKKFIYQFTNPGTFNVKVEAKRKADGFIKSATCPVTVTCDDYSCMSNKDKQKSKLNSIIDEIESWYKYYDVVTTCLVSESIVRAYEYDYTLLGGKNIPGFDADIDCLTSVAPRAYQYKIQALIDSFY